MLVICAFWVVSCSPVARQLAPESVPFRRFCGDSDLTGVWRTVVDAGHAAFKRTSGALGVGIEEWRLTECACLELRFDP